MVGKWELTYTVNWPRSSINMHIGIGKFNFEHLHEMQLFCPHTVDLLYLTRKVMISTYSKAFHFDITHVMDNSQLQQNFFEIIGVI